MGSVPHADEWKGGGGWGVGTRRDIGRELPVPLTLFDVTHPGPGLRAVKIFKF